jgi:hypothetical protein
VAGTVCSCPGEASTGAEEEELSAGTAMGLSLSARVELSAGTAMGLSLSARVELSAGTAKGLSFEETADEAGAAFLEEVAAGAGGGEVCSPRGAELDEPDGAGRVADEDLPAGPGSGAAVSGGPAYDPGRSE